MPLMSLDEVDEYKIDAEIGEKIFDCFKVFFCAFPVDCPIFEQNKSRNL